MTKKYFLNYLEMEKSLKAYSIIVCQTYVRPSSLLHYNNIHIVASYTTNLLSARLVLAQTNGIYF